MLAFTLGLLAGSSLQPHDASPELLPPRIIGEPLGDVAPCGRFPNVAIRKDCAKPRGVNFIDHPRLECIAEAEGSGWQSMADAGYYGRWQMSRSAWESVLHPRFDRLWSDAPRWVQALKAHRLLYLQGTSPWPPAQGRC